MLKNSNRERITAYIKQHPDCTYAKMREKLGISSNAVISHYVKRLHLDNSGAWEGRKALQHENYQLRQENKALREQVADFQSVFDGLLVAAHQNKGTST
jgi:predicted transcriptional regulator